MRRSHHRIDDPVRHDHDLAHGLTGHGNLHVGLCECRIALSLAASNRLPLTTNQSRGALFLKSGPRNKSCLRTAIGGGAMDDLTSRCLREEIAAIIERAVIDYAAMSGMGAWDTPELWMQCRIATALHDRFYVMLEARVSDLLEWNRSGLHLKGSQDTESLGGRVDIVLFERTPVPEKAPVVGLIEIKKHGQRWVEPPRVCRRLFGLSHAASFCSSSIA
jgi:hypothetical protein